MGNKQPLTCPECGSTRIWRNVSVVRAHTYQCGKCQYQFSVYSVTRDTTQMLLEQLRENRIAALERRTMELERQAREEVGDG